MKWMWYEVLMITFLGLAMTGDKAKVLSVHSMKSYRGSGVIPPLILNFGTHWV